MSKIKFFSLGGVQENGKNLYVLEVENDNESEMSMRVIKLITYYLGSYG